VGLGVGRVRGGGKSRRGVLLLGIIISVVGILLFRFTLVGTATNSILFAVSLFDYSCDAIERSRGCTFCWWLCLVHPLF
jgi:hypothetical protein